MKRKEVEADQMPGQDSFLDVITNIVGILILLVLIVGCASRAVHATSEQQSTARTDLDAKLKQAVHTATKRRREIHRPSQTSRQHAEEVAIREEERNVLKRGRHRSRARTRRMGGNHLAL